MKLKRGGEVSKSGKMRVIDVDLEAYFDTVHHHIREESGRTSER